MRNNKCIISLENDFICCCHVLTHIYTYAFMQSTHQWIEIESFKFLVQHFKLKTNKICIKMQTDFLDLTIINMLIAWIRKTLLTIDIPTSCKQWVLGLFSPSQILYYLSFITSSLFHHDPKILIYGP